MPRTVLDRFTSDQPLDPKWETFGWSSRFRLDGCEFHITVLLAMPPVQPPRSPKWFWQVGMPGAGAPPRGGRARTAKAAQEAALKAVSEMLADWEKYVVQLKAETKSTKSKLHRLQRKKEG
jgi:hypothetical protein